MVLSKKEPTSANIENYKKFKNLNLTNQRQAERKYYREQFELHQSDLKNSWNIIKNIIGKSENRRSIKSIEFLINNHYTTDCKIIAKGLIDYFINVGRSLACNIQSNVDPLLYVHNYIQSISVPETNTS